MPYDSTKDLPDSVRHVLPGHAQDIYKEAFNNAYDEYDSPDDIVEIKDLGDGRWLVPGESSIDDVNEALGAELEEGEFSTLAGWIVERLDSVPAQGADVDVPEHGLSMKIVKMDGRRIDSVLVRRAAPAPVDTDSER